jgi:hypothetical protein
VSSRERASTSELESKSRGNAACSSVERERTEEGVNLVGGKRSAQEGGDLVGGERPA